MAVSRRPISSSQHSFIDGLTAASQYNARYRTVITADVNGMIEYWSPDEPFGLPEHLEWTSKAQTGLYEFKKVRVRPRC